MPDIVNMTVTTQAAANVNVPRATVSCQVVHSQTRALLADLTGANAVQFPGILSTLTAVERRELLDMIVHWLLQKKAPATWL